MKYPSLRTNIHLCNIISLGVTIRLPRIPVFHPRIPAGQVCNIKPVAATKISFQGMPPYELSDLASGTSSRYWLAWK